MSISETNMPNHADGIHSNRMPWDIDRVERDHPDITLTATKEMMV